MRDNKISVVINTLNAERILEKCLESVKDAYEIVICDMHSDDKTIEIANNFNCKICYHERCGYVEPARNYAISQASGEWVLILDADELVTPELWQYLKDFTNNKNNETVLEIPRETFVIGQKLRCMRQSKLARFFKKGCAEYSNAIHEHPRVLDGNMTFIPSTPRYKECAILHYHVESIQSYLEKTNRYTDFEQDRFEAKGKKFSTCKLIFRPTFEFIKFYFLKGGIFDGKAGLIICFMNAQYKFIQLAKLYEKEFKKKNPNLIY
ncbi:MAG: glycosyltransferase family 2 protein [Cyanobacteria bacterium SIG30]|nr:glycosyltransferase family 2 protein [Cyanobacteria bacterium SIG30]